EGAAVLDGREMLSAKAVGKQMFLEFEEEIWLRVHLGLYGAWDFAGEILVDPTIASANGRMGQTNQRGTDLDAESGDETILDEAVSSWAIGRMGLTDPRGAALDAESGGATILDEAGENSLSSIGAPRRARVHVRMSEQTQELADDGEDWPPPVVGQVRLRLLTASTCADLRGPTACALQTPDEMLATVAKLGPDPLVGDPAEGEERFVSIVRRKPTAIALLLMDQSVVSGIGNVY